MFAIQLSRAAHHVPERVMDQVRERLLRLGRATFTRGGGDATHGERGLLIIEGWHFRYVLDASARSLLIDVVSSEEVSSAAPRVYR